MAYEYQIATDLNDILALANTFFAAQGWTINLYEDDASYYYGSDFTGKRLHLQKTISTEAGDVECYANLRTGTAQNVIEYGTSSYLTGVACNVSTGFDSTSSWDKQTGYAMYDSDSAACFACLMKTATINCYFFSGTNSGAIVCEGDDQHYTVSFGITDLGVPFFAGSGSNNINTSQYRKVFGHSRWQNTANKYSYFNAMAYHDSTWKGSEGNYTVPGMTSAGVLFGVCTHTWKNTPGDNYSMVQCLLNSTPDTYTGNPVLIPATFYTRSDADNLLYLGKVPDIFFINMKNLSEGEEIEIGSSTYVCWSSDATGTIPNNNNHGYAIRK